MGTHGEIVGDFFGNELTLSDFRMNDVRTSQLTLNSEGFHGGGDDALMADFIGRVRDRSRRGEMSVPLTSLEESVGGHLMAFAAEESRSRGGRVVLNGSGG